ncbi:hypothetical protein HMPREF1556_00382 [Porphyromonas sp. oral taxon 278 str. W7784]|nr:hypothetical protein HMPREF1556_00382 [Porphyromonas sp. oral taxon 278 str. W7784]
MTSSASLLGHLAFDLKGHHNFFGLRGRWKAPQAVKSSITYVRRRQPPSIGNRTAKIFLPHPIFQIPPRNPLLLPSRRRRLPLPNSPPSPRKRKALPKAQNFRAHGRKFSYVRKFRPLRTSIFRLPHGAKFSCAQKKISFRKKIFFLPQGNKFSCGRKFGRLPNGNFTPCGRKEISFRTKINFRICENIFSYIRK